jgi:hypothetical protein
MRALLQGTADLTRRALVSGPTLWCSSSRAAQAWCSSSRDQAGAPMYEGDTPLAGTAEAAGAAAAAPTGLTVPGGAA